MASPTPTTVNLKLLIHTKSQRLLFAEAGKDFVDFLFSIMSLLLGKQATAGCIGNIYESIENLGNSYMLSEAEKDILLKPLAFNYGAYEPLLILVAGHATAGVRRFLRVC
ncbi:hypothetical protein V6N13_132828 [Hibiscus sabdariffa]|uniref:Uncharacterized protein n=1 Tax=Hibiscus sabdariffa TaxID=183260 RepID=A0ABR1ZN03_9ROSI